ncbi:MAG TPA: hypothetical protein DEF51_08475, partial [Myxococcales bacterium]|nr:hypothetical protein [Myxococcales bacterium]
MGDFDGDGVDDLAYRSLGERHEIVEYSGADLHTGAPRAIWSVSNAEDLGLTPSEFFGRVLLAGDFDGDGIDDLAVADPSMQVDGVADAGAVLFYRGTEGLNRPKDYLDASQFGIDPSKCLGFGADLGAGQVSGGP